jgi:dephospho-CoA kinase
MIIGLTGSMGSGKSQTAKNFKKLGVFIIDADKISKQLTAKGKPATEELVKLFGRVILKKDNSLNRKKLAEIIFDNPLLRRKTEKILHGLIITKIKNLITLMREKSDIVIDAPLLFESGLDKVCDKTVTVWTKKNIQMERLLKAGKFDKENVKKRIASQLPIDIKMKKSDYVIDNNGSKKELYQKTKNLLLEILSKEN